MTSIYAGSVTSHSNDPLAWQRPDDAAGRPVSASLVDPEDDLPSTNYAGDFETTAIPHYDANGSASGTPGFGLLNEPEPLPYVQPGGRHSMTGFAAEPAEIEPESVGRATDRRGTLDLGILLLRLAIGALFIGHGLQKAFGLWGGPGLNGWEAELSDMGFRYADILTYVATGGQIAAGVLLILGLFTPVAAAGALAYLVTGVLADAMEAHEAARLSDFLTDGHEYKVFLACAVAALVLTGPGRYGFDAGRGWARRPFIGSFGALVLGAGAGIAIWVLFNGGNPFA
ncbi:membrane protein [Mycolicibacterium celeriflavum]|uniref:Membrane protein n=1 Tax=Mycolicibacterium celeriflavum TaxID=1249101 RepID=A0A7I7RHJ2_MYCCF|nr:membrane protein [Mycolicibacterium celeriflavum]